MEEALRIDRSSVSSCSSSSLYHVRRVVEQRRGEKRRVV
jgi:hypothetical protein